MYIYSVDEKLDFMKLAKHDKHVIRKFPFCVIQFQFLWEQQKRYLGSKFSYLLMLTVFIMSFTFYGDD